MSRLRSLVGNAVRLCVAISIGIFVHLKSGYVDL